jgi:hypothetical protein
MKKKMMLRVDDLSVASFETHGGPPDGVGTVRANAAVTDQGTCQSTCVPTICNVNTCTCGRTCFDSCTCPTPDFTCFEPECA